jgi:hypothetical protein
VTVSLPLQRMIGPDRNLESTWTVSAFTRSCCHLTPSPIRREFTVASVPGNRRPEVSRCLSAALLVYVQNNGCAGSRESGIRSDTLVDNDISFSECNLAFAAPMPASCHRICPPRGVGPRRVFGVVRCARSARTQDAALGHDGNAQLSVVWSAVVLGRLGIATHWRAFIPDPHFWRNRLALLAGFHNFSYLWYLQPYPLFFPLIFLAIVIFNALAFGALFLPRLFAASATPRLHIHWAVVALLVPFVPSLILHALNPAVPIFHSGKPAVRLSGEVIFALWTPSAAPLTIDSVPMPLPPSGRFPFVPDTPSAPPLNLTAQEAQRLRSAGITGHIQVSGMSALTNSGRIVLIMSRQLDAPFQCFAPVENADVIYLQTSAGWQKLPHETPDSKIPVRLYIPEGKPKVTGFAFDNGSNPPWREEPRFSW